MHIGLTCRKKARMQIIMHVAAVALQLASRIVNLKTDDLRHEDPSHLLVKLLHLTRGTARKNPPSLINKVQSEYFAK